MLTRAPLDLRANRIKAGDADLATLFPEGEAIPGAPDSRRPPPKTAAIQHPAHAEARSQVQHSPCQYASAALVAKHGPALRTLSTRGCCTPPALAPPTSTH